MKTPKCLRKLVKSSDVVSCAEMNGRHITPVRKRSIYTQVEEENFYMYDEHTGSEYYVCNRVRRVITETTETTMSRTGRRMYR